MAITILGCLIFLLIVVLVVVRRASKPTPAASRFAAFSGPHDCSVRALLNVLPELPIEEVRDAFMQCTEKWPNGGVSNVEFNVVLRYLNIFDLFQYNPAEGQSVGDFRHFEGSYILLIYGHFTVIDNGNVLDSPYFVNLDRNQRVYCSWKLTKLEQSQSRRPWPSLNDCLMGR